MAARQLGYAEAPCMVARGWSEAQIKAYRLADNELALHADWNPELLKIEFGELKLLDFDLDLTGFSAQDINQYLATPGLTDPDAAPEPPATPVTRPGDVWLLGEHRLLCGDATSLADVQKALGGAKPHLMVTDPPYGVDYDPNWRNSAAINGATRERARGVIGGRAIGEVVNDDRADWREAWALFHGDVAYVWHGAMHVADVKESLAAAGLNARSQIIWAKNNIVISRGHYHFQHEPCWYAVRKGKTGHWQGSRTESSVWTIDKPMKSETGHSTQKPVECMKRPIENNSGAGESVYDPFVGSGTTIIAGEMTGRIVHAIEISPAYVDVSALRWMAFTGKDAILESTGRTFAEVKAERLESVAG